MDKTYSDFAQLMTGTLAIQTAGFEGLPIAQKHDVLAHESALLIDRNTDISYVEYKDKSNNIIYTSKKDFPVSDEETVVNVSSPIIHKDKIVGYVTVGMTGKGIELISSATKKTLFGIFILTWLTFAIILLLNMTFMSRELKKLYSALRFWLL